MAKMKHTPANMPMVHSDVQMTIHSMKDMQKIMDGDSKLENKKYERKEGD